MSSASTNNSATQGPDFWELTNFGTNTVDLSGYIFNDADAIRGGDGDATTLSGVLIGPGESIILVQTGTTVVSNRDDFINWWGATKVPTNLQVLFYTGNGLSSGGDSIVLWAPTATSDDDYLDRVDFGEAARGQSFIYNPTNGDFGVLSSNLVGGAFTAATTDDVGSPGRTTGAIPLSFVSTITPTNLTVPAGANATFTVSARAFPHPRFQWKYNGTDIPGDIRAFISGGIRSTLTITNVQTNQAGLYSVTVSNGLQTLVSASAQLTVTTSAIPPSVVVTPTNADAFFGQLVRLNAQVGGSPTPSLQWEKDNSPISGETSSTLTLFNVQSSDSATYKLVATSTAGTNSAQTVLTVGLKPRLLITEVQPSGSGETGHQDWWELTSFDSRTFNLKGWRWDDNSHSVAPGNAYVFTNDIFIHPGESMVFVENMSVSAFKTWWGTNLLPGLQVNPYIGGGLGLSQTADEVNLWNAVTQVGNELLERVCSVTFASTSLGWTLVYDSENPPVGGVFNVSSTNTVAGLAANGVFAASQVGSFGSPGYVVGPIRVTASADSGNAVLTWNSVAGRNYTVQYKNNVTDATWRMMTNVTASGASTTVAEPLGTGARIYRVGAGLPFVSEP